MPEFPDNCNPRVIAVDDSCGCTLTRANIRAMTPQDFADQAMKEVGMDRIIAQTKEARTTGVPERSLIDLFNSKMVPLKKTNISGSQSIIAPFTMRPQRHRLNINNFSIQTGFALPGGPFVDIRKVQWVIKVNTGPSPFKSPLVKLERYFLPGRYIMVFTQDAVTKVNRSLQFKIISAVNSNEGAFEKADVVIEANYTLAGWNALSSGEKTVYNPTRGTLILMANSVSDYESWCYNDASDNAIKLLVYWEQTSRDTHCYNDEYLAALAAPLTSEYWKRFKNLPLAQQRKQQAIAAEKVRLNTYFYGQRINENQTVEGWTNLPQVVDPNTAINPDCVLEYKANTLGIRTQLQDCGRVTDMQGATLNLDTLFEVFYNLKRNREADSSSVEVIDLFTDRFTSSRILEVMNSYYKLKYGTETTRFYKPGEKLRFDNQVMFTYNLYDLPDQGMQIAVYTDSYFDDRLSQFDNEIKSSGRSLWAIDWSDIEIGIIKTASATRKTNELDNLYNCVIKPNINHYQLNSTTYAVMVQDPNRSALVENFSGDCPTVTATPCVAIGSS